MGTYLVMKNNIRRCMRHKLLFCITFLLPVTLCIITGIIRFDRPVLRVGLLGIETNQMLPKEKDTIYEMLNQSKGIVYRDVNEATIHTELITGKYQMILDYRKSNARNDFILLSNQKEDKTQQMHNTFREAFLKKQPIPSNKHASKGLNVTERSIAILMSLFIIFSTLYASRIIRDYDSGVITRYQYAYRNKLGYVTGYWLYVFAITFVQVLLSMGALLYVQEGFFLTSGAVLILSMAITTIATFLSMVICQISKTELQSNLITSSVAAVFSLLGGTFMAVEVMPWALRVLSILSPIRWVVELYRLL